MTTRTRFEVAMVAAGWTAARGLFGGVQYWRHSNGYQLSDDEAYRFWRRHGQTPTPF